MSKLEIKNLSMGYKHKVLDDLNLELEKGQIVGLVGPNGAGKVNTFKNPCRTRDDL